MQFTRIQKDITALAGAGETAFQLGEYRKARLYLETAVKNGEDSQKSIQTLSLAQTVLANDPLAPHIGVEERQRWTLLIFNRSFRRLEDCIDEQHDGSAELESLKTKASAAHPKLRSKALLHDPGLTRTALELAYQIEKATSTQYGGAEPADEALLTS